MQGIVGQSPSPGCEGLCLEVARIAETACVLLRLHNGTIQVEGSCPTKLDEFYTAMVDAGLDTFADDVDPLEFSPPVISAITEVAGDQDGQAPCAGDRMSTLRPLVLQHLAEPMYVTGIDTFDLPSPSYQLPRPSVIRECDVQIGNHASCATQEVSEVPLLLVCRHLIAELPQNCNPHPCGRAMTALELAERFGCRRVFVLDTASLSIAATIKDSGYWVGLQIKAVSMDSCHLSELDAHITLAMQRQSGGESPHVERLLPAVEKRLASLILKSSRVRHFTGSAQFCADYARENFAWMDILISSRLHGTCHQLLHVLSSQKKRPAFHMSFRHSVVVERWAI